MKTRLVLSISMARYFLTTAELCSGKEREAALYAARRELARYWAIKFGV